MPIRTETFMAFRDPIFKSFSWYSGLPELAAQLLESNSINIYSDAYIIKPPGCEAESPWHHDMTYYPVSGSQMLSTWVALDPVTEETGRTEFVAGSHRWDSLYEPVSFQGPDDPVYAKYKAAGLKSVPDINADRSRWNIKSWDLDIGDLTVHHVRTLHFAGANKSSTTSRRALVNRYAGEDIRWSPSFLKQWGGKIGEQFPVDPGLKEGEPLTSEAFPKVWSRAA